jgi:hypothetical protein
MATDDIAIPPPHACAAACAAAATHSATWLGVCYVPGAPPHACRYAAAGCRGELCGAMHVGGACRLPARCATAGYQSVSRIAASLRSKLLHGLRTLQPCIALLVRPADRRSGCSRGTECSGGRNVPPQRPHILRAPPPLHCGTHAGRFGQRCACTHMHVSADTCMRVPTHAHGCCNASRRGGGCMLVRRRVAELAMLMWRRCR